jgi:hypothetical protein
MAIFFLMNAIVVFSAYLLAFRFFRFKNTVDAWINFFLLYFSQIIFTELMLGIEMRLFLVKLLILNTAVLFAVWLFTRKIAKVTYQREGLFGLVKTDWAALLAFSLLLGFVLVKTAVNLPNPPLGWDSLNYHFTYPVEWLKNGNLNMPITINDDPSPPFYPINGSLFFFWLILPLRNVFLADLGQIPFFIIAFFLVYNLTRKFSVKKELSFFAACLFVLIPNFFKQAQIAYVDIMVAVFFLAGVNYLLLLKDEFSLSNLAAFALSAGLLIGTKTVALPYACLLLVPFLGLAIKDKCRPGLFFLALLLIIGLGGFTYVKNFIRIGNPFFPMEFRLFGKTIFKGVMDASVYSAHFEAKDYSLAKILFSEGLGAQTLIFILPGLLLALPLAIIKDKEKKRDIFFLYVLALPLFLFLTWRFLVPLANTRYLYPMLGLGIALAFYLARILSIPAKIIKIALVICLAASIPELARRQELIAGIVMSAILFMVMLWRGRINQVLSGIAVFFRIGGRQFIFNRQIDKWICVILTFLFGYFALIWLNINYQQYEYVRYRKMVRYSGFWPQATEAWEWLNNHTTGNNIAYVGRPVPFPLYGTNFKNNVYYVSVNRTDPAKLHYFPGSRYRWGKDFLELHRCLEAKGNYRGDADYAVWLSNLARHNTEYLFIYSLHQTRDIIFPMEDYWAKENPDKFTAVFTNDIVHIYKIRQ